MIILVSIILSFFMTQLIEDPIRTSNNDKFSFKRLAIMGSINLALIGALFIGMNLEQKNLEEKIIDKDYPGVMAFYDSVEVPKKKMIPDFSNAYHDTPLAYEDRSYQTIDKDEMKIGEYGETENYDATIALIGSSTTLHWQGAILDAAKENNLRVLSIIRFSTNLSTEYNTGTPEDNWNQSVLNYLEDSNVDLVITQATYSDNEQDQTQKNITEQLLYIKNQFDIDILALRDIPRYSFNVLETIESYGKENTIKKMNNETNQKDTATWNDFKDSTPSLYKLDTSKYFKIDDKFKPIIGNILIYRDNRHLTNSFSKSFGPIFEDKIINILNNNE